MAKGHREAAPRVLDGREHDGTLAAEGRPLTTRHIAVYPRILTAANTAALARCRVSASIASCTLRRVGVSNSFIGVRPAWFPPSSLRMNSRASSATLSLI